jgi:hypothetical protein
MALAGNYKLYREIKVKKKPWLKNQPGPSTNQSKKSDGLVVR